MEAFEKYLPQNETVFKQTLAEKMINATVAFCILYSLVYLGLGLYLPAAVEAVIGALIWLNRLFMNKKFASFGIYFALLMVYFLIVIQIVTFFGGSYGFQYLLYAHMAIMIILFAERKWERKIVLAFYTLVNLGVIYYFDSLERGYYQVDLSEDIVFMFKSASRVGVILIVFYMLYILILEIKKTRLSVDELSRYDDLLPVLKQSAFMKIGNGLFQDRKDFILLLVDSDYFKSINDTYGHERGDEVLIYISKMLQKLGDSCCVARYGGSSFAVLLLNSSLDIARDKAIEIANEISETPIKMGGLLSVHTTVSMGMVSMSPSLGTFSSMISRGDEALYLAKARGRNQVIALGKM